MKIHLKQIPAQGLHLEGEENCPLGNLEGDNVRCAGALQYKLDVGISGESLWASGTLHQPVELQCVSCLDKFTYAVEVPGFAVQQDIGGPETVDLTPFIREDILLNLPAHPHCDRDGGRTCSAAQQPKSAPSPKIDAAAKLEHDWGELDKLKAKLKRH